MFVHQPRRCYDGVTGLENCGRKHTDGKHFDGETAQHLWRLFLPRRSVYFCYHMYSYPSVPLRFS